MNDLSNLPLHFEWFAHDGSERSSIEQSLVKYNDTDYSLWSDWRFVHMRGTLSRDVVCLSGQVYPWSVSIVSQWVCMTSVNTKDLPQPLLNTSCSIVSLLMSRLQGWPAWLIPWIIWICDKSFLTIKWMQDKTCHKSSDNQKYASKLPCYIKCLSNS